MRDSHAVAKARRSLGLALMKVGDDSGRIGGDAQFHGLRGEGHEDGVLVGSVDVIERVRRIKQCHVCLLSFVVVSLRFLV